MTTNVALSPTMNIDARGSNMSADQIRAIVTPMLQLTAKEVLKAAPAVVETARRRMPSGHRS